MSKKEIPEFKTEKEEAEFWDTHSFADYWDDLEDVKVELAPELKAAIKNRTRSRLKAVTLRLREDQIAAAKKIAVEKDIPYQVLIRSWISQAIRSESR